MGLSLGRKRPQGAKLTGYNPNKNVKSTVGIKKASANGVVNRKTSVARGPDNSIDASKISLRRNNVKVGHSARGTEQTVGIRAKLRKPGIKASIANSTGGKVSSNHYAVHPSAGPTSGLKGVSANGLKGSASRSSISRGSTSKGSLNTHVPSGQSSTSAGLRGVKLNGLKSKNSTLQKSPTLGSTMGISSVKSANRGGIKSTGTIGKVKAGGTGIPKLGGRRAVSSSLPVQKVNSAGIPAAVLRAARRAPTPTSSKPTYTSKTVKITSI